MPQAEPELKGQENTDDLAGGGYETRSWLDLTFPLDPAVEMAAGSAGGLAAAGETTDNSTKRQTRESECHKRAKEGWKSAKVAMSRLKSKSKSKKSQKKSRRMIFSRDFLHVASVAEVIT